MSILTLDQSVRYRICVQGRVEMPELFCHPMEVRITTDGAKGTQTELIGELPDQSALYGLLEQIRDLGLPLRRVHALDV